MSAARSPTSTAAAARSSRSRRQPWGQPRYTLNQNQALCGGGIFNSGANAAVALQGGTNIVHNKAFVNGGGVFNDCGATTTLTPGALILFNTPNQMFTNLGPCLIN